MLVEVWRLLVHLAWRTVSVSRTFEYHMSWADSTVDLVGMSSYTMAYYPVDADI